MPPPPPRLGDRYHIGDLLGRGGTADVHRAHDTVLDRSVAVKVLRDVTATDTRRFADEARLLAALDHPHVVSLLDAGVSDDRPWLALELVEGPTLHALMATGRLDSATAQRVGHDVASALAHAHDHGVVHRDVKPSNIMIRADGAATLTDFGIARLDGAGEGATLTGHTIGTAAYLSPEQVRAEEVTGAADVFALGLVLLEALTATRAYPGPATESALARLHHSPLIPTSLPTGWPGLLAAMTAAAADERPSAAEVAGRLGAARFPADLRGAEDAAPTVRVRLHQPVRRRVRLVGIAAALALAGSLSVAQTLSGTSAAVAEDDGAARPAARGTAFYSDPGTGTARTTAPTTAGTTAAGTTAVPAARTLAPTPRRAPRPDRSAAEPRQRTGDRAADRGHRRAHDRSQERPRHGGHAGKPDKPGKPGKPDKPGRPDKPGKPGKHPGPGHRP